MVPGRSPTRQRYPSPLWNSCLLSPQVMSPALALTFARATLSTLQSEYHFTIIHHHPTHCSTSGSLVTCVQWACCTAELPECCSRSKARTERWSRLTDSRRGTASTTGSKCSRLYKMTKEGGNHWGFAVESRNLFVPWL